MTKYNYSYKTEERNVGKAVLRDVAMSPKHAIEICSAIRYKSIDRAKTILEAAMKEETPIKFTRFTEGAGHKRGTFAAKFPVKAAGTILKAINSAESNAIDKGLSKNLKIIHILAQRASAPWHYGRQRRIKMKRTHLEIFLKEIEEKKKEKKVESEPELKVEEKQEQTSQSHESKEQLKPENTASATVVEPVKVSENKESKDEAQNK